jgi:hypothetical protein
LWGVQEQEANRSKNSNRKTASRWIERNQRSGSWFDLCLFLHRFCSNGRRKLGAEVAVPSSSKINLAPSLFSPLLTASTTSRCRPSPSQHETYVIRVTRPAGILRASSKCREVCFAGPGRVRLARLHRVNTYERILQKCMKLPRLDCMLIGSGRSRGLSLVAGPISSSFCMSTAIRNISADAERCDARTVSNHQPVEDNVLNPEASTIRQARQYKDWSNKNCRRCRHTTFALQYEMTRIIPTSGVFGARKTWSSLSECLSPSSVSSSFCSCSSLSFLL